MPGRLLMGPDILPPSVLAVIGDFELARSRPMVQSAMLLCVLCAVGLAVIIFCRAVRGKDRRGSLREFLALEGILLAVSAGALLALEGKAPESWPRFVLLTALLALAANIPAVLAAGVVSLIARRRKGG